MKVVFYSLAGIAFAAAPAFAQSTEPTSDPAAPAAEAGAPPAEAAAPASDAAAPADAAAPVDAAQVSDTDIDNFAKATVKLQAIQEDAAIAADQKQTAMAAAVAEVGLDPVKYNAIGKAAAADATLRAKVQTAMSKYAPQPSEG